MSRACAAALLTLLVITACKPVPLRLAHELDRSSSWLATVTEVIRANGQNRTPKRYAEDAIADALAELAKAERSVDGDGKRIIAAARQHIVMRDTAWLSAASDTLSDLARKARQ